MNMMPRQPQPVVLIFQGDDRDVEIYLAKIQAAVERNSYDNAVRAGSTLTIYPRAVND